MPKLQPSRRLKALNALLSAIAPEDTENRTEISKAVDFFLDEVDASEDSDSHIIDCARSIFQLHLQGYRDCIGLAFWEVTDLEGEPLWMRAAFLSKLNELAGYSKATLLICGLQEACRKGAAFWSKAAWKRFEEARNHLDEIALTWHRKGCDLTLIYF